MSLWQPSDRAYFTRIIDCMNASNYFKKKYAAIFDTDLISVATYPPTAVLFVLFDANLTKIFPSFVVHIF